MDKPVEKAIVKQNRNNRDHVPQVKLSPDGRYFLENISETPSQLQLHMWDTQQDKIVKTFPGYNAGVFSTNGEYTILSCNGSIMGSMTVPPLLYSMKHDKSIPLLVNIGDKYSPWLPNIDLSSNNRYIKFSIVNLDTRSPEYFLMEYDNANNQLTNLSLKDWGSIGNWQFTSDGNHYSDAQHMLYTKDGKTLAKRTIGSDHDTITYPINANASMRANNCLVSLQYNDLLELLFITNENVQVIQTSPYPDSDRFPMNLLHIPETGLIIYQSGPLSFHILNKDYKKVGSYSLQNAEGYNGWIKQFVTNEKKSHLVALYDNQNITPSKIICFNLSDIGISNTSHEMVGTELKCNMRILALKFITNKKLLAQGTKTKIINIDGNKGLNFGESQSSSMHANSILTIYHTPFNIYSAQDVMNTIPAKTTLTKYTIDKALLDD